MRRMTKVLTVTAALLGGSFAQAANLPNFSAYYDEPPVLQPPQSRAAKAASLLGVVTSIDEQRGVPTFVWASQQAQKATPLPPGLTSERAALWYLKQLAPLYRLSPLALGTTFVKHVHDIGRGAIIVKLGQSIGGIDVFETEIKVVMNRQLELVAVSGNLHEMGVPSLKGSDASYVISPQQAIVNAFEDLYGITLKTSSVKDMKQVKAGAHYFDLAKTPEVAAIQMRLVEPARIKQVYFPLPDRLVAAYWVELLSGKVNESSSDAHALVVAADDGRVLYRKNLTQYEAFTYNVWADTTGNSRPLDGPHADFTPHPTGMPDGSAPAFIAPSMVTMDGFNTNPLNTFDPWLTTGSTETVGNNVDAYTDHSGPDGYTPGTDLRANITSPNTFNYTYDTALTPLSSQNQSKASVAQLFFVNNWLHDWFYDSGFTEAAGNAQNNNFGRGGAQGDRLRAEAQDGALAGQSNNANMSTPLDGTSPRMQMYIWDGPSVSTLTATPPGTNMQHVTADFGLQSFNVTADVSLTAPADGCTAITTNLTGKIAVIDRGTCQFNLKTSNAENAGAVGVIIANNAPGLPPHMGNGTPPIAVNIGAMGISQEDGNLIKMLLMSGNVSVTMNRQPPGVQRDGTIDNHIVAHEWGHYIHHRLVLSCSIAQCGAQSEGWGDFTALNMAIRPGDNLNGTYAAGVYAPAVLGDSAYFGIRRYPYSTDFTKNALTFKHISDGQALPPGVPKNNVGSANNSEVHNAGEVWTTMMFESYIELLQAPGHTFDEAQRLMSDYVVGGMQAAVAEPTFTEQRDGILATAAATSVSDLTALATAFAKRGAGTCAVSPPKNSIDLTGVVEDFQVRPTLGTVSLAVDDSIYSCDDDGLLDGEEKGYVTVTVQNSGVASLDNTQVTVSTTTPGVSFPNGASAVLPSVAPYSTGNVQIEVNLDSSFTLITPADFTVNLTNNAACVPNKMQVETEILNIDNTPNASASDDVESEMVVWTAEQGGAGYDAWQREVDMSGTNHIWHGEDTPTPADPRLVSPNLVVANGQNFILTFVHRHSFEFSGGINWDGAVIEISEDNGNSWNDIEMYGQAPYNGVIGDGPGGATNALDDRQGFVAQNPAWPNQDNVSINMGTTLAGKTVKLRFRTGADDSVGDIGWEIDNIAFQGITNTPFAVTTADMGICGTGTGGAGGTGAGGMATTTTGAGGTATTTTGAGGTGTGGTGVGGTGTGGTATTTTGAGGAGTGGTGVGGTGTGGAGVGGAGVGGTGTGGTGVGGAGTGGTATTTTGVGGAGTGGTGVGGTGVGGTGGTGVGGTGGSSSSSSSTSSSSSSSSSSSGSGGGTSTGGGQAPVDEGGCGCSTVGNSSTGSLSPLAALALLLFRRRRRTAGPSRS